MARRKASSSVSGGTWVDDELVAGCVDAEGEGDGKPVWAAKDGAAEIRRMETKNVSASRVAAECL